MYPNKYIHGWLRARTGEQNRQSDQLKKRKISFLNRQAADTYYSKTAPIPRRIHPCTDEAHTPTRTMSLCRGTFKTESTPSICSQPSSIRGYEISEPAGITE